MSFLGWLTFAGALLLLMALSSAYVRRLPVSSALVYLLLGIAMSPIGLDILALDARDAPWLERLTEIAVIISLYIGGLRLRLPVRHPAWRAAYRLAGPVMLVSIAGVTLVVHQLFDVELGTALLIGAVLAPTDPVLAGAVAVSSGGDRDRMRYGLSGEAGLNDGMAFPFVVFALLWIEHGGANEWIGDWAVHRLLWAVPAALVSGFLLGVGIGRVAIALRTHQRDTDAPSDFLALAVIALAYVGAESIGAWGFLAVFAAGVGMRRAEMVVVAQSPHPEVDAAVADPASDVEHPPAEDLVRAMAAKEDLEQPAVAAGLLVAETLSFGHTAERMLEVLLVLIVGIGMAAHWDARAIPVALCLFVVIRPLSTWILLRGTPTSPMQRAAMGWFGIRGIGSLYYLGYALRHELPGATAELACNITFSVVALSIVVHGMSAQPLLDRYERALSRKSSG